MIDLEVTEELLKQKDESLLPAPVIIEPGQKYLPPRKWQGVPSITYTGSGQFWISFYSGGNDEGVGNFVLLKRSVDNGQTWSGPVAAVDPGGNTRAFDPCLWTDPQGRLWLFWAQSYGGFDGRAGVWASFCTDHLKQAKNWSYPVRIGDGVMMNKPIVRTNGEWLLPIALWERFRSGFNPNQPFALSNVYASADCGQTFARRGGAAIPKRYYDETVLVEKKDGTIWMLVRLEDGIGQAFSIDGGVAWEISGQTLPGPNSRFQVMRLQSGNLMMINHQAQNGGYLPNPKEKYFYIRSHLTAYLSEDDGETWLPGLLLDEREGVSYPDAVQAEDGNIFVVYDRNRYTDKEILLCKFTEEDLRRGGAAAQGAQFRRIIEKC